MGLTHINGKFTGKISCSLLVVSDTSGKDTFVIKAFVSIKIKKTLSIMLESILVCIYYASTIGIRRISRSAFILKAFVTIRIIKIKPHA